ncbi:hypothetical protein TeGR_g5015 [Tetraparma gracilis]|uniref:Uncharacterized protein n=1 Tax=Tetraparma gracilis TaxID=2962635 RepID=A0ABQ6MU06_9STRA|nr:hypothetical protein TeGR_g5015 [Tetraparma gracilis]
MKSYGSSASGLQCAWGSDLDTRIPRPKMPKQALPDSVRKNLGFKGERKASRRFSDNFEIAPEVHATKGGMEAKAYLKMKSGVPMSTRTSGLAAQRNGSMGGAVGGGAAKELHRQQMKLQWKEREGQQLGVVRRQQQQRRDSNNGMAVKSQQMGFGEISHHHAADGRQRAKHQPGPGMGSWR